MTYDLAPVYRTDAKLGAAYDQSRVWAEKRRTVDELVAFKEKEGMKEALYRIGNAENWQMRRERDLLVARNSFAVAKGIKKGKINISMNMSPEYESEALKSLARLEIVLTAFGAVPEEELRLSRFYGEFETAKRLKLQEEQHLRRIGSLGEDISRLMSI